MFTKTSSYFFNKYGDTYYSLPKEAKDYDVNQFFITNKIVDTVYYNTNDVFIKVNKGIAVLCVSKENQSDKFEQFVIHHTVFLKKNCYYNFFSISDFATINLYTSNSNKFLAEPIKGNFIVHKSISPTININQILVCFYQVKNINYIFKGEEHDYWELTYIDSGHLITEVDGVEYHLNQHDILIYSPNQFHTQKTDSTDACSYLTVMFKTDFKHPELLNNQVFHASRKIISTLEDFIESSDKKIIHSTDLSLCLLNQVIIQLLQLNLVKTVKAANSPIQQKFEDEFLNEIMTFINQNIYQPLSVDYLCHHFSISRSSLQQMFNKNLDIAPKKYLTKVKLKKAKLLIKENKYTISEVSDKLGFTSIHYFSRKFKKEFNISPSDYAKSIYKE